MKILIAAATEMELEELKKLPLKTSHQIDYLVHGVGMVSTATLLSLYALKHHPDFLIQCGIAGTYSSELDMGESVVVGEDEIAELGSQDINGEILSAFDLGFMGDNKPPFTQRKLCNPYAEQAIFNDLKKVQGLTVHTSSGFKTTIDQRISKYQADIETMEGAAFHYVALTLQLPFFQIRGISNLVEPRNMRAWQIPKAIKQYSLTLNNLINQL